MLFLSLSLLAASCSKNMYTAGMDKVQKSEFEALASSLDQSIDYEKNYIRMMQIYNECRYTIIICDYLIDCFTNK